MITFRNVSKFYDRNVVALENINLEILEGEFVSIIGQSGAGKSTLLKLIFAEERPSKGNVFVKDRDMSKIRKSNLPEIRRQIGVVFQDFKLLEKKTVFENIAFALEVSGKSSFEIERNVPKVLEIVGLSEKAKNYTNELSGGEKQRVSIARALIHSPDIIVADEPTGNLDIVNSWSIIQLLMRINQFGTTVVLATHNREIVNLANKRVITIDKGKITMDQQNEGKYLI